MKVTVVIIMKEIAIKVDMLKVKNLWTSRRLIGLITQDTTCQEFPVSQHEKNLKSFNY